MMSPKQKAFVFALAGMPVYALLAFQLMVVGWRVYLGVWPRYGRPGAAANQGLAAVPEIIVFVLLAMGVLSCVLFVPAAFVSLWSVRLAWLRKPVAIWACGWSILVLLLWLDPGRFLVWFIE